MKKTNYSIQIDNSCAENWNAMTKTDNGKFCAMCEKNIIDFSKLTDNEILKIIGSNNKNLCGRFTKTQLNRVLVNTNEQTKPLLYQILAGLLLLSSCDTVEEKLTTTQIEIMVKASIDALPNIEKTGQILANTVNECRDIEITVGIISMQQVPEEEIIGKINKNYHYEKK